MVVRNKQRIDVANVSIVVSESHFGLFPADASVKQELNVP